ncbi:MAG: AMP-binding protein, partial [Pseudomonas aeruginosa]|nr:AMP-binding protein [Pseudomonas aeruginosa]
MYGITETTVHVTAHECSENAGEARSPIGRPMDGLRTYVLDAQLQPVQPGETGMMYVAGPQVTAGYWGLASTTASRFVADPFVGGGARMYCSNDMAKVLNNGHLDYVGRADRQVQLRGYRVELGEIESALEKVSGVREATVVVVDLPEGQVPGALLITDSRADAKAITSRAAAAARDALPAYMVPQLFAVSTQVPQTINGKRDERAILDLLGEIPAAQEASGTSDLVEAISQAIADALRLDRAEVEPDSDFFRLGGDSILAIRVTHALARADLNVTPRDFFLGRTPRKIAERVTPQATQQKIQETRQSQEEALPKDGHQEISGAFPIPAMLRRQMERGMSDRFVQARRLDLGPVAVEDLEQALQQVAQAHPMLRTRVDTSSAFAHFVGAEGDGPMVVRALDVDALIDHIDIAAGRSVVLGCV